MSKYDLYIDQKKKDSNRLSKDEKADMAYAQYRWNKNTENWKKVKFAIALIKSPYTVPRWFVKKITFKSTREVLEKENKRLRLVAESKARARNSSILDEIKYDDLFKKVGFKDKLGNFPIFNSIEKDGDRETIEFKSNLSLSDWLSKKESLETVFDTNIVSIRQSKKSKQVVLLDTTKKNMPKLIKWDDEYLVNDGILPIGQNIFAEKINFEFVHVANILVGGAPRGGKTKLFKLLGYQILRTGGHLIIAEFKGVDYQGFENKCQVINDHQELLKALKRLMKEMDKRRKLFRKVNAENIDDYNKKTRSNLKRYYLLIDELGEAMEIINPNMADSRRKALEKDIADLSKSLARLASAFGIHLVFGTQRPDVKIIEGQTRDQFIGRICFKAVRNTSNIVLESEIASNLNSDDKGRAYIKIGADYKEVQVFLFEDEMLKRLPNRKLSKKDLELLKSEELENENRETDEVVDVETDL